MSSTIKPKLGTTAQWQSSGRVLEVNEWGVEQTTTGAYILRIGDGEHLFHELPAVFNADTFEAAMAQMETTTEAANTATANANAARDTALTAAQSALTAAETAERAAQVMNNTRELLDNTAERVSKLYDNAITETVSGEVLTVADSSDMELMGLKLYGKTTQATTEGYQLFDASKLGTKTAGGCTVTNNGDGSLTISGSGTLSETFAISCDYTHEESVALLQEGTLHLAVGATNPQVVVYLVRNGSTTALDNSNKTAEITQEMLIDTTFFIRLSVYGASGSAIQTGTVKPMLYQNGDGTFEPYTGGKPSPSPEYPQELTSTGDGGSVTTMMGISIEDTAPQSITTQTPNGLRGIPVASGGNYTDANGQQWICDEVDFARGVYVQRVYTKVLKGTEIWNRNTFSGADYLLCNLSGNEIGISKDNNTSSKCTHAKNAKASVVSTLKDDEFFVNRHIYFSATHGGLTYVNADDWKTHIAELYKNGAPIKVQYILAVPIETPLSAEEIAAFKALHTNKPNTTVYNDAGAHMEMEYIADTKLYIDNKFTALQNAILSAGANV